MQITAFGTSEVPDVKMSAQIESMSGSRPGSFAAACGSSASASDAPMVGAGSSASANRLDEKIGGSWSAIGASSAS